MITMKSSVIREMTTEEIQERLADEKEMLAKMRMQHAISPLENPLILREKRKDIARLMTELNRRLKEA
ncbi:MAG: 50S ribosomal protein L29 [Salibacteraceae bacterium]